MKKIYWKLRSGKNSKVHLWPDKQENTLCGIYVPLLLNVSEYPGHMGICKTCLRSEKAWIRKKVSFMHRSEKSLHIGKLEGGD